MVSRTTMPESTTETEGRILAAVLTIARALAAEVRLAGASAQLNMAQFSTLHLLSQRDLSVSELARTLRVAMPTVTQSVDTLTSKGLVERYPDERDRRQVWLRVTPQGRRLLLECRRSAEGYLARLLASWPQERPEKLAKALESLARSVEEGLLVRQ